MPLPVVEIPRVLTPRIAEAFAVSRARIRTEVRRGNWHLIARGAVLTRPEEPTRADWAALGIAVGGRTAALSGWDAVRLAGFGTSEPPSTEVLVLSRHGSNRVIGQVRIRETNRPYRISHTSVDAGLYSLMPLAPVARAVIDTSRYYGYLAPVRSMVTTAVQRRRCSVNQLLHELVDAPRNHTALFREALVDLRDGACSEAEARASSRLAREPIPAFELNVPIIDRNGTLLAVVDVLWRNLRSALEIDSREFHFSEAEWKATMARHNSLTRRGLAMTHYPPSVVFGHARGWLDEVRDWLYSRACDLGRPWCPGGGRPIRDPEPFVVAC